MTVQGSPNREADALPDGIGPDLTVVELTWKEGRVEQWLRFGKPTCEHRIDQHRRRFGFGSGWAIFVEAQRISAADYPDSHFPDPASALVDAERRAAFAEQGVHFQSEYFLTFLYLPPTVNSLGPNAGLQS